MGTREVGNVDPDAEITFQFGASDQNAEGESPQQLLPTFSAATFKRASSLVLAETSWTLILIKSYQRRTGGFKLLHLVSCAPRINPDFAAAICGWPTKVKHLRFSSFDLGPLI